MLPRWPLEKVEKREVSLKQHADCGFVSPDRFSCDSLDVILPPDLTVRVWSDLNKTAGKFWVNIPWNTMLPAYCDTGYCDKTDIVTVLAIPIPKWHFYTKQFAGIVTFLVNYRLLWQFSTGKWEEMDIVWPKLAVNKHLLFWNAFIINYNALKHKNQALTQVVFSCKVWSLEQTTLQPG